MASLLVAATLLSYTSIKSARTKRAEKKRSRADARVDELKKWEEEEEDDCRGGMTEKGKVGKVAGRGDNEGWRGSSESEEDRGLVFGDKGVEGGVGGVVGGVVGTGDEVGTGGGKGKGRGRVTEEEKRG